MFCFVIINCSFHPLFRTNNTIQLHIAAIPEHDGMIFREALEDAMNGYFSSLGERIVLLRTRLNLPTTNVTNQLGMTVYTTIKIQAHFDLVPENFNGKVQHLSLSYVCGALGGHSLYTNWQVVESMKNRCLRAFAYRVRFRIIELLNEN